VDVFFGIKSARGWIEVMNENLAKQGAEMDYGTQKLLDIT
jgi:hypothetical protein